MMKYPLRYHDDECPNGGDCQHVCPVNWQDWRLQDGVSSCLQIILSPYKQTKTIEKER